MKPDLLPHEVEGLLSARKAGARADSPRLIGGLKTFARHLLRLTIAAIALVTLTALLFATLPGVNP